MRRALSLVLLAACGTGPAVDFVAEGIGAPAAVGPRLQLEPSASAPGLTFRNLRADGELLAVDVDCTARLADVYGVALRVKLEGASFVRAEAADAWPIFRAEAGALVLSAQGSAGARAVPIGRLATVWFRPAGATGRLELDALRSAVVDEDGRRRGLSAGAARWSR